MALRCLIKPKAKENLFAAAQWYQEQEQDSNLAVELFDEFDTVLECICERPCRPGAGTRGHHERA